MSISKNNKVLIDFEDAFTSYSGIPTALVNDALCLVFAGFDLILWYSDKAKTIRIKSWMNKYLNDEQKTRVQLLETRPVNKKMWIAQILPWFFRVNIMCDFTYATLFPRLPIIGNGQKILRIYDPFGNHKSALGTAINAFKNRTKIKNICARAIRTYSYRRLSKDSPIKIYISEETRKLCYTIYEDESQSDLVIYPTVQFAIQDILNISIKNEIPVSLKSYFIFIGGQRQKKDPLSIINLWAENLKNYKFDLVVVGSIESSRLTKSVREALSMGRLTCVKNLSMQDLRTQIVNSMGVIYNTLPDGFGYPVAEGIYLKKPVICNDLNVFREIAGDYPYFFKSGNFVQALQILTDIYNGVINPKKAPRKAFEFWGNVDKWKISLSVKSAHNSQT